MFGHRYFGSRYFGQRYFGPSTSQAIAGTLAAAEVGVDAASFAGEVLVSGALDASELSADTALFAGFVGDGVTGALAASESGLDRADFLVSIVYRAVDPWTVPRASGARVFDDYGMALRR